MVNKKPRGPRAKTKHLFRKRRKASVNKLLEKFENGQRVVIKANSSVHSGFPNKRFHSMCGVIEQKQGNAYIVKFMHGKKEKRFTFPPAHIYTLETKKTSLQEVQAA